MSVALAMVSGPEAREAGVAEAREAGVAEAREAGVAEAREAGVEKFRCKEQGRVPRRGKRG